jgi:hypothetical protein
MQLREFQAKQSMLDSGVHVGLRSSRRPKWVPVPREDFLPPADTARLDENSVGVRQCANSPLALVTLVLDDVKALVGREGEFGQAAFAFDGNWMLTCDEAEVSSFGPRPRDPLYVG